MPATMHWVDWAIVIVPLLFVLAVAVYTRRYTRSVADFLSAGRCAGRYLLANARGESDSGLANSMSQFEVIMVSAFMLSFWQKIQIPVTILIGISGFVLYRFRETRALTLAQFLEMRYSRSFRLFMGGLAFVAGILNYGIFPAVSARFFVYFLNLPATVHVARFDVPTSALIMAAYLTATVFMIFAGGQVTLIVADGIQGIFSHLAYLVIALTVLYLVGWSTMIATLQQAPPGHSTLNPFDAKDVQDFNVWYVLMSLAIFVYRTMAHQNKQGFNSAALTPHDFRMSGILMEWRGYARMFMLFMLALGALAYLKHPAFAQQAGAPSDAIAHIGDAYLKKQMTVPVALRYLLPVGIKGLFVSIMVMGMLAGDAGHLHSWGSIFVQDVVVPLQRRPMSPHTHIWVLRGAVSFVALFAFAFSMLFTQTQYIRLWWDATAGIFVGGAGAAIIGGLYWRYGTTAAAWVAMIAGSTLAFTGIICNSPLWPFGIGALPAKFWLNGQQVTFWAANTAVVSYVIVSLATCREPFNLERMLHRGQYAIAGEKKATVLPWRERFRPKNLLKFNEDFTFADKLAAGGIFWWSLLLAFVTIGCAIANPFIQSWPTSFWPTYWFVVGVAVPVVIGVGTFFWFGIGGVRDIFAFFRALHTVQRDDRDDGRVTKGHNLADESPKGAFPVLEKEPAASGAKSST